MIVKFCFVFIALFAFDAIGVSEGYILINDTIKQKLITSFQNRSEIILNQNRGTVFYRIGTLLNEYDLQLFQTNIFIDGKLLKGLESFETIMKNTSQNALQDGEYASLIKKYITLAGKVNHVVEELKFFTTQATAKNEKPRQKRIIMTAVSALFAYFNDRSTYEKMSETDERLKNLETKTKLLRSDIDEKNKRIQLIGSSLKSLGNAFKALEGKIDNLQETINQFDKRIKDLYFAQSVNKKSIELLDSINSLNTFLMFLQDIIYDIRQISAGLFTIRPILYQITKLDNSSDTNTTVQLINLLKTNADKEGLALDKLSEADLLGRYLFMQFASVNFDHNTYDLNIRYNSYFISFDNIKEPLFELYSVNQYLVQDSSTVYAYNNIPEMIAVDRTLTYFMPFTVKDSTLCTSKTYISCQVFVPYYPIAEHPCIKQLFFYSVSDKSISNCTLSEVHQVYGQIIRISKTHEWNIFEGRLYDSVEVAHLLDKSLKCEQIIDGSCVIKSVQFTPRSLQNELQNVLKSNSTIDMLIKKGKETSKNAISKLNSEMDSFEREMNRGKKQIENQKKLTVLLLTIIILLVSFAVTIGFIVYRIGSKKELSSFENETDE